MAQQRVWRVRFLDPRNVYQSVDFSSKQIANKVVKKLQKHGGLVARDISLSCIESEVK